MDTLTITLIIVGCAAVIGFAAYSMTSKTQPNDRPDINIDFDTAKEREDKNRYFS